MKPSHRKILAVSYIGLFAACFLIGWWHESLDKRARFYAWMIPFPPHTMIVGYVLGCLPNPQRRRARLLEFFATAATFLVGYLAGIGLRTLQH